MNIELLLTVSVQAAALILLIALAGFIKRLSPKVRYALWLIPAARLVLPFSIELESPLSLMGVLKSLTGTAATTVSTPAASAIYAPSLVNAVSGASVASKNVTADAVLAAAQPAATALSTTKLLLIIWLAGVAVSLCYAACVNIAFFVRSAREREYVCDKDGLAVFKLEGLASPCLAGILKPHILVNATALRSSATLSFALAHERAHYEQMDHVWALIRSLICCAYWFNPFVWLAAVLSRRDCELACDERVMRGFDSVERERYGMALISLLCGRKGVMPPLSASRALTGSKRAIKTRIDNIASKPAFSKAATALALAFIMLLSAFACAAPSTQPEPDKEAPATVDAPSGTGEIKSDIEPTPGVEPEVTAIYPKLELVTENGTFTFAAGEQDPELAELIEKCIFGSLVLSAAWPGVDVEEYKPYIVLNQQLITNDSEETHKYYAFVMNGKPCLQGGMYTALFMDNFKALLSVIETSSDPAALEAAAQLRVRGGASAFDASAYTQAHGRAVADVALSLVGKGYALNGYGPDSFDMAGLVYYALNEAGVKMNRLAAKDYYEIGYDVSGIENLLPGDIILFSFDNVAEAGAQINGCGIYVGDGDMVIASSSEAKVRKTSIDLDYFRHHFHSGRRLWQ